MSRKHRHRQKGAGKLRVHWETVTTVGSLAPSGREGHSADVVNGSIYTFGGLENGARVSKLLSFNLINHRWMTQSDRLALMSSGSSLVGGKGGDNPEQEEFEEELPESLTSSPPAPRCYHDSWVVGHRLLCFGGEGSTSNMDKEVRDGFKNSEVFDDPATQRRTRRVCFDDVSLYNTLDHSWEVVKSGLAPLPRKGHTCNMVGTGASAQVVVFGGEPSGKGMPMNDTHCVTVTSLLEGVAMWEKQRPLGDLPSPRHGHTAVALVDTPKKKEGDADQSYLVVFGGTGGGGLLFNDVYTFGLVTKEWEIVNCDGTSPSPRYGHTACMIPKRHRHHNHGSGEAASNPYHMGGRAPLMVVFGGVTRNGSELSFCRDMQILNMNTKSWTEIRTTHLYPSPRYGHAMVVLDTKFDAEAQTEGKEPTESPYTSSNHIHVCKLLIFGGLNQRYCSNEIWSAEIQMMKDGRETWGDGFDDADGSSPPALSAGTSSGARKKGRSSVSGDEFETVNRELMKERKLKIIAEERLIAERKLKQKGLAKIEQLESQLTRLEEDMLQARKETEAQVERVRQAGIEDRNQLSVLREELSESRRLLSLMDLSGQIRVKAWQQRALEAEERLDSSSGRKM